MEHISSGEIRTFAHDKLQNRRVESAPVRKLLARAAGALEDLESGHTPPRTPRADSAAPGTTAARSEANSAAAALVLQNAQEAAARTLEAANAARSQAESALSRVEADAERSAASIIATAEQTAGRIIEEAKRQAAVEATAAVTRIEDEYRRRAEVVRDEANKIAASADRLAGLGRTARETQQRAAEAPVAGRDAREPDPKRTAAPTDAPTAPKSRRRRKKPTSAGAERAHDHRPPPPDRVAQNSDLNAHLFGDDTEIDLRLDPPTKSGRGRQRSANDDFFGA